MSVGERFAGLDMESLISGPLTAAADASILLAKSTADFINDVEIDANGRASGEGKSDFFTVSSGSEVRANIKE